MKTRLLLYVAGGAPNSIAALATVRTLLASLDLEVELEIVDVFEHPHRALEDGVLVTPMLVRVAPGPRGVLLGNLGDGSALRQLLLAPGGAS